MDGDSSNPANHVSSEMGLVMPSPSQSADQTVLTAISHPVSTPTPASASGVKKKQKKVRIACERCRYRRVKCDGQIPACGNCSKAGVPCIDVDSRDAERRLMRGSSEQAAARIAWLENIIQTHLPYINLDDEQLSFSQVEHSSGDPKNNTESFGTIVQNPPTTSMGDVQESMEFGPTSSVNDQNSDTSRGTKRSLSAANEKASFQEGSIDQEARSVALELGLLSLNSDSRQMHYLGSSSGTLFAPLFLAKKPGTDILSKHQSLGSPQDGVARMGKSQVKAGIDNASHTEDNKKAVYSLYEQLRKDLPPRDECNILLNRFFSHMHPNHPFLHRPSFNYAVNALYQCVAVSGVTSFQHNGWPVGVQPFPYNGEEYISDGQKVIPISAHVAAFQLLVALSIGATLQIRSRRYSHNPRIFFNSALNLSKHVFGSISLPVLQSTLLVAVHSLIDPDGCDVWTLTHIAMAHAVDLGIHREASNSGLFSPIAIEIRRRVFFCVYSLDRSISTIQGRPLGLGDDTFDAHLPEISEAQIQLVNINVASDEFDDVATLSYSIQTFKIAQLVSKIKSGFYKLQTQANPLDFKPDYTAAQNQLHEQLGRWLADSIATVSGTVPEEYRPRLTTKLQILYHGAICLLHQPSQVIAVPSEESLNICFSSAIQRLHLFEVLYDSGALCHSWRTVQDMFLAGATIMYSICISPAVRNSVSILSLSKDFRACSSMLSVGGEWWPTIRKAKYSLERLSNYILEMLAANPQFDEARLRVGQPFPQDYTPDVSNWQRQGILEPNLVQQTFMNVVYHDGRLIDFFDEVSTNVLMDGMQDSLQGNLGFDAEFWDGLNQGTFEYGSFY